jgi:Ferritin-like domain
MSAIDVSIRRHAPAQANIGLYPKGVAAISEALNALLADVFAVHVKTKNFHWHVAGPHLQDYHLLLVSRARKYSRRPTRSPNACVIPAGVNIDSRSVPQTSCPDLIRAPVARR